MSRPVLGAMTLMQTAYSGFDHPARAQVVSLLAADPATSGNAVLQSAALGFRQATVSWVAPLSEVETARGYHEALSSQAYTDHDGTSYTVRVIAFSAAVRVGNLWDVTATLLEMP